MSSFAIVLKTENINSSVAILIGSDADDILIIVNSFLGLIQMFWPWIPMAQYSLS